MVADSKGGIGGALIALVAGVFFAGYMAVLVFAGSQSSNAGTTKSSSGGACVVTAFNDAPVPNGWAPLIEEAAGDAGVPPGVLAAQLDTESGWNPKAESSKSAQGLAQFTPGTWESYGDGGDPFNPEDAIAAQGRYMKALTEQVEPVVEESGSTVVELMLAAYNAGPGAVQQFSGIPPYAETQNYVEKIMSLSTSAYGTTDDGAEASCGDVPVNAAGESTWGDDFPWKNAPIYTANPHTGMFYRECVDFALWRLNQQVGSTAPPFTYTNSTFTPDGSVLGNAVTWKTAWQKKGWPTSNIPVVGSIAWYDAGASGADPTYGHVAVVKAVLENGQIVIEEYNGKPAPEDHQYGTRTVDPATVSLFLHIKDGQGVKK